MHRSVGLVVKSPTVLGNVIPAQSRHRAHPHLTLQDGHGVHEVVGKAAVELGERVKSAGGGATESSGRADPKVLRLRILRDGKNRPMGKPVGRRVSFPSTAGVTSKSPFPSGPNAIFRGANAEDFFTGQAIDDSERLPMVVERRR